MTAKNTPREFIEATTRYFISYAKLRNQYSAEEVATGLEAVASHRSHEAESDIKELFRLQNEYYLAFKTLIISDNSYLNLLCFRPFQDLVIGMKREGVVHEKPIGKENRLFDWELLRWLHRQLATGTQRVPPDANLKNELRIIDTLGDCGYPRYGSIDSARKSLIKQGIISKNTSQDSFRKRIARFDFGRSFRAFNSEAIPSGKVPMHVEELFHEYQDCVQRMGYFYPELIQRPTGPTLSET